MYAEFMGYKYYNPNPLNKSVEDCTVRAISKAFDISWNQADVELFSYGFSMKDVQNSSAVFAAFLREQGYMLYGLPLSCPNCYTIRDFCNEFPSGTYIVATGSHVVTVIDGDYYDAWDSGNEVPAYFWTKEEI